MPEPPYTMPAEGFVRLKQLLPPYGPIPASRSTIYDWIAQGKFPAPVSIGPGRIRGFDVRAVRAFLADPRSGCNQPLEAPMCQPPDQSANPRRDTAA